MRWSPSNLSQLHQWQLWLTLEQLEPIGSHALLPMPQRQLCHHAMVQHAVRPSRLQRAVGLVLASILSGLEEEVVDEQTGYSLDLALRASRVAVEVDGPTHFLLRDARGEYAPTGPSLLKRRQLEAAGWVVINVPFYEWQSLGLLEQRGYLERKLSAAGAALAPSPSPSPSVRTRI